MSKKSKNIVIDSSYSDHSSSDENDDDKNIIINQDRTKKCFLKQGEEDKRGELQIYYANNKNFFLITFKVPFLIGARLAMDDDFNLDDDPYGNNIYQKKKKMYKPAFTTILHKAQQHTQKKCSRTTKKELEEIP